MLITKQLYKQDNGNPSVNLWHSGEAGSLFIYCNVVHEIVVGLSRRLNPYQQLAYTLASISLHFLPTYV